jgi:HEPN domain-containing protein
MPTDQQAVQLAVKTLIRVKQGEARIVRIRDTLSLEKIAVSEPMLSEVEQHPDMSITGEAEPFAFAADGTLSPM